MMKMTSAIVILSGLISSAWGSEAVQPKPVRLALFKNGYAHVMMTVQPAEGERQLVIKDMPVAVHGTLWFDGKDTRINRVVGRRIEGVEKNMPSSLMELALANPGAAITVATPDGKVVKGKVKAWSRTATGDAKPNFLGLETETGLELMSASQIVRLEFDGKKEVAMPSKKVYSKALCLELETSESNKPINIECLSRGITWAPSYRFELGDNGAGLLVARTDILNELMDVSGVKLDLVTGFPNIKYAEVDAPICMTGDLRDFFSSLREPSEGGERDARSQVMYNYGPANLFELPLRAPNDIAQSEDLSFHTINDFTCKKGETVSIPLFTKQVSYEHIMEWIIQDDSSKSKQVVNLDSSRGVWHCVRFVNALDTPLTTAPVEFVSKGRFIGQGTIVYTPSGQKSTVRVNQALDLVTSSKQTVVSRSTEHVNGKDRIRTDIDGEMRIKNLRAQSVVVEVTNKLIGQNKGEQDNAEITVVPHNAYNDKTILKWKVTLEPRQEKTLRYSYYKMGDY